MENVIFDNESERYNTPADHTAVVEMFFRDALDDMGEENVIPVPKINQHRPGKLPISVSVDPFVLGVSGSAKFRIDGCQHETDVVVGGGVDQVSQFFLARPAIGFARRRFSRHQRLLFGESLEKWQLPIDGLLQHNGKMFWQETFSHGSDSPVMEYDLTSKCQAFSRN